MSTPTTPAISLSEQTKVRMPLTMLLTLLGAIATAAVVYGNVRGAISDHGDRIAAVEKDQRTMSETLARIDENVKRLVREDERRRP